MGYINDLLRKLKAMDADRIVEETLRAAEADVVKAQQEQLMRGEMNDGSAYTYKDPVYADMKARMNPLAGGYVDAYWTGSFQNAIYLDESGRIKSRDRKYRDLLLKYPKLLGLNADTKARLLHGSIKPTYKQLIQQATGLRFGRR